MQLMKFTNIFNHRAFGIVLRVTVVFLMFHITAFLAYQNPWPQEFLQPNSTIPRLVKKKWDETNK